MAKAEKEAESPTPAEEEPVKSRNQIWWEKFKAIMKEHWFLVGMVVAIVFALIVPSLGKKGGIFRPEYSVKYGFVTLTFLITGMSLKTEAMKKSFLDYRFHIFSHVWIFVITPLVMFLLVLLLRLSKLNDNLIDGCLIMMCFPSTITSCVVLTQSAKGNDAAALVSSTVSNVLGIVVSPALIFLYYGRTAAVELESIFLTLGLTVLLPVIVGQVIHVFFFDKYKAYKTSLGNLTKCILLIIIWTAFCETFSKDVTVDWGSIVAVFFFLLFVNLSFMTTSFFSSWRLGFPRPLCATAFMVCPQKTLALGLPLLTLLFEGNPEVGIISLPILMYHPMQLVTASISIQKLKAWVEAGPSDPSTLEGSEYGSLPAVDDEESAPSDTETSAGPVKDPSESSSS